MTSAAAATPFSLTMEQERAGANGFEVLHAISEFIDNAFDAGSPSFTLAYVYHTDNPHGPATLIGFDTGEGARDLDALYSIGTTVLKKTGRSRGLKNYGNRAAMGRLMPSQIVHLSCHRTARYASTLIFNLADLYAAIDEEKRTTGTCDYRRVDATITATNILQRNVGGGLNKQTRDILAPLRARIASFPVETYAPLTEILDAVITETLVGYHMMLLQYDSFPIGLEASIIESFKSYHLTYSKAIQNGLSIRYLSPTVNPDDNPPISSTHVSDAVDPLGITHPRLSGHFEFRGDTMVCFTITDNLSPAACYWLTCNPTDSTFHDGRIKYGPFKETPPAEWDAFPITGRMDFACAVPSKEVELEQHKLLGKYYDSTNYLRGVYLQFMDRILGPPIYNTRWVDPRNANSVRVVLSCDNHAFAEKFWKIQTKKHSATINNLHRVLETALNWIVNRVIIQKYSMVGVCPTADGKGTCIGVTDWKFTTHFRHWMLNTAYVPLSPPVPSLSPSSPSVQTECGTCGRTTGCVCPPRRLPLSIPMCSKCGITGGAGHICEPSDPAPPTPTLACSKEHKYVPSSTLQTIYNEAKFLYIDSNLEDLCDMPLTKSKQAALAEALKHLNSLKALYPKLGIKRV